MRSSPGKRASNLFISALRVDRGADLDLIAKIAQRTVYRPSNGYWFVINTSDGHITVQPWGIPGDKAAPADYDGDGKIDFAVFRPSDGNWWIINSSTGHFSNGASLETRPFPRTTTATEKPISQSSVLRLGIGG